MLVSGKLALQKKEKFVNKWFWRDFFSRCGKNSDSRRFPPRLENCESKIFRRRSIIRPTKSRNDFCKKNECQQCWSSNGLGLELENPDSTQAQAYEAKHKQVWTYLLRKPVALWQRYQRSKSQMIWQWWWFSGQCPWHLLRWSKFESCRWLLNDSVL